MTKPRSKPTSVHDKIRGSKALAKRKYLTPFLEDFGYVVKNDLKALLFAAKEVFTGEAKLFLKEVATEVVTVRDIIAGAVTPRLQEAEEKYQLAIKTRVDPLFRGERQALLQQLNIGGEDEPTITPRERQLNRDLALAGVITAAAVVTVPIGGAVAFVACVPLALYLVRNTIQWAYKSVVQERRLTMPVVFTVNQLLLWFGGFYILGGVIFIFMQAGQKLSYITESRSRKQLTNVFGTLPQKVWVLKDGVEVEVPFEQLRAGDVLVFRAGQMIPIDGVIIDGYASIDQHRLTGEAQPAEKGLGDSVLASTVVLAGRVQVRVEKSGEGTLAAQIGEMLNRTVSHEMAITSKARQLADRSVTPTLVVAGLAWLVGGTASAVAITSTMFGLTLILCGPLALRNYLLVAARRGILVKDGRSLDLLTEIDTVVFDKTGTLTLDQPHVTGIHVFSDVSSLEVLRYAAAVEQRQSHPIARSILSHARLLQITLPEIDYARLELGYGLQAGIENRRIRVGSNRFMTLEGIAVPPQVRALQDACHIQGHSLVMVAVDGSLAGAIELAPTVRPEAKAVIGQLRQRNLDFCIISGDQEGPTRALAQTLGIHRYFANVLPEDKARLVEQLQREGRAVCFVGDGINDSIALKKANVSVSLHGATTVAMDTAQIVLMDKTLAQLPLLFQLAEEMESNLHTTGALAVVPSLGIWTGVFLFHLGILGAALIFEASLWAGIGNSVRPLLKYKEEDPVPNPKRLALPMPASPSTH